MERFGALVQLELVEERRWWVRTRSKKEMAALRTCEQGGGARELRKASNDKNDTESQPRVRVPAAAVVAEEEGRQSKKHTHS